MGRYTNQSHIELAIGAKGLKALVLEEDDEQLSDSEPQARLAAAIEAAEDAVDAALSVRYAVPVSDGDQVVGVRELATWKAVKELFDRAGVRGDSDEISNGARLVDARLEAVREGREHVVGLAQTKGLPGVAGSVSPLTTRAYETGGAGDPDVANDGKTDPLEGF